MPHQDSSYIESRRGVMRRSPVLGRLIQHTLSIRKLYMADLDEADSGRLLTEALTAEVETILADETSLVSAEAANNGRS